MFWCGCLKKEKQMSLTKICPTKRAPDAGDSAHIPSSFLRLSIFLVGRLRRPRPSAGNANRWADTSCAVYAFYGVFQMSQFHVLALRPFAHSDMRVYKTSGQFQQLPFHSRLFVQTDNAGLQSLRGIAERLLSFSSPDFINMYRFWQYTFCTLYEATSFYTHTRWSR
jgi:hypothetical protein